MTTETVCTIKSYYTTTSTAFNYMGLNKDSCRSECLRFVRPKVRATGYSPSAFGDLLGEVKVKIFEGIYDGEKVVQICEMRSQIIYESWQVGLTVKELAKDIILTAAVWCPHIVSYFWLQTNFIKCFESFLFFCHPWDAHWGNWCRSILIQDSNRSHQVHACKMHTSTQIW